MQTVIGYCQKNHVVALLVLIQGNIFKNRNADDVTRRKSERNESWWGWI